MQPVVQEARPVVVGKVLPVHLEEVGGIVLQIDDCLMVV